MKRLPPEFVVVAAAAVLIVLGCLAPEAFGARPPASAPRDTGICLPEQAGGIGMDFYAVDYPDEQVVIYTYFCNGQPRSIIALYEWKPATPLPTRKAMLAAELKRLDTLHGYSNKITTLHQRLAERQLEQYQPTPAEVRKQKVKAARSVV